ncbi:unnamed protein product [Parascedosporium putredinis]|uniref:BTB domain-containing protein n=1 Tax=Parascedosporium putredinis TaxID=1442378 RepID=A0A9P1GX44_9PEZI|nr:unnamed protein product [Parascedosporium putredinis]CAI7989467.1 unnamed protein product [Parascedosporium putredinis]
MFGRSFRSNQDQTRVDKAASRLAEATSFPGELAVVAAPPGVDLAADATTAPVLPRPPPPLPTLTRMHTPRPSPIVTLTVGREGRLFAAHENVLCQSSFFDAACRGQFHDVQGKRISLPDEEPEVFSAVLEYLYKGDYYPRLIHNNVRRASFSTAATTATSSSAAGPRAVEPTVYLSSCGDELLRDTVIYCAADRYGLDELKLLALRKQGLQSGIDVGTILRSAAYAYAHTPDSDSRLRAHYLALIIRCRRTFKRSGTMQAAMEQGGSKLFFDLFVAMCNHLDDVIEVNNSRTPRTV